MRDAVARWLECERRRGSRDGGLECEGCSS